MHSGVIEHMCINPDGPLCYCGNHGCLETYCSANALVHSTGLAAKEFFPLIDAPIIISGYLAPFFTEEDILYLLKRINTSSPFVLDWNQILVGTHGQYTPAIGAALFYVEQFIQSV